MAAPTARTKGKTVRNTRTKEPAERPLPSRKERHARVEEFVVAALASGPKASRAELWHPERFGFEDLLPMKHSDFGRVKNHSDLGIAHRRYQPTIVARTEGRDPDKELERLGLEKDLPITYWLRDEDEAKAFDSEYAQVKGITVTVEDQGKTSK